MFVGEAPVPGETPGHSVSSAARDKSEMHRGDRADARNVYIGTASRPPTGESQSDPDEVEQCEPFSSGRSIDQPR